MIVPASTSWVIEAEETPKRSASSVPLTISSLRMVMSYFTIYICYM